ncbi:peptidoglycan hydrolase-like protein with peptidoglycan-binding domain [Aminobacter ciceronei]|uniref:Peptidoglycan hydrolase-like protein with peptidoglycan-binding domain n=1 Tax=Aminobacter ciceronei TaxID=150723 RepID=A0ABR6C5X4_9HYPH|nr:peptidoglycan hydrolase-like protein with peptidoglycan-binding domain [Aminobacter ciceronei]MBA9020404.1 peptidoglycan hydrolase-like protein with peptidoglycan-binding domain [Aminobacter ciceronei]
MQFAMLAFGYYNGELDGVMGPDMRAGLQRMQADYKLKVTGTITPETLDALKIEAR